MNKGKKLIILGITLLLGINVVGCGNKNEAISEEDYLIKAKTFNEFVEKLPGEFYDEDDLNINYTFEHPENFGYKKTLLKLPVPNKKDYVEGMNDSKKLIAQLKSFDRSSLKGQDKLTYDILLDYFKIDENHEDFYYFENNLLGSFIGFQAQLPLLLVEYKFNNKNDLDSYFNILKTSEATFKKYATFEKERQENEVGMPKVIVRKVIQQCENFAKEDDIFLSNLINEKIDTFTFLNDQEKVDAKAKNTELVNTNLRNAYVTLGNELTKLEKSATSKDGGLSTLKNGKDYYEYLLKQSTGVDMTPKAVKKYLESKQEDIMNEMMQLIMKHPEWAETYPEQPTFTATKTANETLDYLGTKISEDFPALATLNYKINPVPDSMKDNFSPAAFITSRVDAPMETPSAIFINGEYDPSIFTTIAHEGYPGHMYQDAYFKSLQLDTIRYMINYQGYAEGWATYVENISNEYMGANPDVVKFYQLNNSYTNATIGLLDIDIHYESMSRNEFSKKLIELFGDLPKKDIDEQYDLILETPANYNAYYLSCFMLQDYRAKAEKALGNKFDLKAFNQVLLDCGPSPFKVVEKQVNAYIKNNK
ncbi:MAG: DUF885 domain-containing protein [Erysipelotrichaceae bacterium]